MKKLLTITIAIILMMPQQGLCLRPIAKANSKIKSLIQEAKTPVEKVRQEAQALWKVLQPVMDKMKQLLEQLSPQEELSKDAKKKLEQIDQQVDKVTEIVTNINERLIEESKNEKNKNREILLKVIIDTFGHLVMTMIEIIREDTKKIRKVNELTDKNIERLKELFLLAKKVPINLMTLSEVRLDEECKTLHIPKFSVDRHPLVMSSFDTEISSGKADTQQTLSESAAKDLTVQSLIAFAA